MTDETDQLLRLRQAIRRERLAREYARYGSRFLWASILTFMASIIVFLISIFWR